MRKVRDVCGWNRGIGAFGGAGRGLEMHVRPFFQSWRRYSLMA